MPANPPQEASLAASDADGHAGGFYLPVVVGSITHAVLAAEIGDLSAGFSFFKHGDDLFLGVSLCFH